MKYFQKYFESLVMKNLNDFRIFIETARLGSISACARQMDITPAAASAAIKRLEAELNTLLFIRSTRSLRLTEQGEQFLPRCRDALELLDNAYSALQGNTAELSGTIRLSSPSDLGRNMVLPWLDDFMDTHPQVELQLHLSDSYVDLYSQNIDLALRYGEPKDSAFIALPIAMDNRPVLCASPDYLKKYGTPKTPQELAVHNCLCLAHQEKYLTRWTFTALNSSKTLSVDVSGNRRSKDGDAVRLWALAGKGIARKSQLDVAKELSSGDLVEVSFTDWHIVAYPLYLLCAEKRLLNPTVQALKEHLINCVKHPLWKRVC